MMRDIMQKVIFKEGEKGFNLIELTVALFLLTVGLLPLFGVFISTSSLVSEGGRHTRAVALAQDKIEEARSIHYDSLESGTDTIEVFTREWEVENSYVHNGTTYEDVKKMVVSVIWMEEGGVRKVQWSSLFAETAQKKE